MKRALLAGLLSDALRRAGLVVLTVEEHELRTKLFELGLANSAADMARADKAEALFVSLYQAVRAALVPGGRFASSGEAVPLWHWLHEHQSDWPDVPVEGREKSA